MPASNQYPVRVEAENKARIHITNLVPNSTITLDQVSHRIPVSGEIQLTSSVGAHNVSIPASIEEANVTYTFNKWSDGDFAANRTIYLEEDTDLSVFYRVEYFVQVSSPVGAVTPAGWRDENSTMEPSLQSSIEQSNYLFRNWTSGSNVYGMGEPIPIRSPVVIQAIWGQYPTASNPDPLMELWLPISVLIFLLMLGLNLKFGRRHASSL